jgi:phosphate transport system permease protein
VVLAVLAVLAAVVVALLPTWMYGGNVNGVVHRTVISGPLLLVLGTTGTAYAIRRLLRASPSGQDLALVPVFGVLIVIAVFAYSVLLVRVVGSGVGSFRFDLLTTAWHQIPTESGFRYDIGFLNNILGTFLLIGLTLLFAILPGVGAGVFMSQYPGRVARLINFCTTMLRAISMFIIGAAAFGLIASVGSSVDSSSFLSQLVRGGYFDGTATQAERGSFVLAAIALALVVMPVIARQTEEGLRSVPREIQEGSVALGATDGYGLRRILLPWAAPNILTALILGGAEAAGGLAIVMFLAGVGDHGIGPLNGATTLDFAVFATKYGPRTYFDSMKTYQFTAALLLLILTVGLTFIAMGLQRRFAKRYRGSLTAH